MIIDQQMLGEIVFASNHKDTESVLAAIRSGDIDIYKNIDAFFQAGYKTADAEHCIKLSNGYIVYFVGG